MTSIDLNCDLGEGIPGEEEIAPWITSANISCGAHAGTPAGIQATIGLALEHGLAIGAHPGFEDRSNFGRRPVDLPRDGYRALVSGQMDFLAAQVARAGGGRLSHLKLHGALYHMAAHSRWIADETCDALLAFDPDLALVGPAESALEAAARTRGIAFLKEGFSDRRLLEDGRLAPRSEPGAVIIDPLAAGRQAIELALGPDRPDTLCVHGDNPAASAIARGVRQALETTGIAIRPPHPARQRLSQNPWIG